MSDTILVHSVIVQRALFDLKNELTFTRPVYKGYSEEYHARGRYQVGATVTIHLPNQFRDQSGPGITIPDTKENSTTIVVDRHRVVPFDFTAQQLTLNIEDFSRKYIRPATITLANRVDVDGTAEFVNLYNSVGTPGTTPSTFGVLADAALRLDEESVPPAGRVGVFSPKSHWAMADGELKSVFQQKMVDQLIRKGFFGNYAMFDVFKDQNIGNHTTGSEATRADGTATVRVKTQPTEGDTSIALKGLTASTGTIFAGDVLTFATVAGVNTISGNAWEGNTLRQFVCTADATADASGDATVSVSPAIISGAASTTIRPYQTVSAIPAVNDNVTILGQASTAYTQNILFHPDCFAMTMVPFEQPESAGSSVKWATATDEQLGIAITFASAFDITNYKEIYRLDILYGWDTPRPNLGVRLWG